MATNFNDTTISKDIRWNRASRDFDCFVNDQYIGSCGTHRDAESLCNEIAYDLITSGACYTATELDGACITCGNDGDCPDCDETPAAQPFGTLVDGTQITGEFSGKARWGVVYATVAERLYTADDAGFFAFRLGDQDVEGVHLNDLRVLRDMLNAGAFERLYAASVAWARGDTEFK